jgi:hypothetical protein
MSCELCAGCTLLWLRLAPCAPQKQHVEFMFSISIFITLAHVSLQLQKGHPCSAGQMHMQVKAFACTASCRLWHCK